jgi:hypothetical protein
MLVLVTVEENTLGRVIREADTSNDGIFIPGILRVTGGAHGAPGRPRAGAHPGVTAESSLP